MAVERVEHGQEAFARNGEDTVAFLLCEGCNEKLGGTRGGHGGEVGCALLCGNARVNVPEVDIPTMWGADW
jgi:hypothetical protein